ncbi:MAG: hypothetical protein KKE17_02150, partial [Proteobacteria bacterium]|nr:hypothetical protein [Pseudomonadota bacterium]MBU1708782.1 hypothetical protein [Pseudomonadota bacterium]
MKKIIAILMVLLLSVSLSFAGESHKKGASSFWGKLRRMIESVTPKKQLAVTTAVGGVRGAKNQAEGNLYWKGEETEKEISEDELVSFTNAVQTASEGDTNKAMNMFDEFIATYPESSFIEEAKEAREMLKAEAAQPAG